MRTLLIAAFVLAGCNEHASHEASPGATGGGESSSERVQRATEQEHQEEQESAPIQQHTP